MLKYQKRLQEEKPMIRAGEEYCMDKSPCSTLMFICLGVCDHRAHFFMRRQHGHRLLGVDGWKNQFNTNNTHVLSFVFGHHPICYLRPFPSPSLDPTQTQGHEAGSSPPSPPPYGRLFSSPEGFSPFLPRLVASICAYDLCLPTL